jgi:hypothetical protein
MPSRDHEKPFVSPTPEATSAPIVARLVHRHSPALAAHARAISAGLMWLAMGLAHAAHADDSYTVLAGWDRQLFPSYLVATATVRLPPEDQVDEDPDADITVLGDHQGVLGVELTSPSAESTVTVTVQANGILEESSFEGTLDEEGSVYRIFPRVRYKYDVLTKNRQSVPLEVTFTVDIDGEQLETQTVTVTLRSINDCPWVIESDGEVKDISFMFAAYVNEQHPFVDKILREALDQGAVDSFTGYQSGDPAEVYRQVYAIWNALSQRDVRYSNITTEVATNRAVASQHVRLVDESINNGQANCVDGSVLLASLLRKIDIEPSLVYVPGHCYLAFALDAKGEHIVGLETTLIGGAADADDVRDLPDGTKVVDDEWRATDSWATFCAAVQAGEEDMAKNAEKFNQDDPEFQIVSIKAARAVGILPIAFDSSNTFKAVSGEADE